MISTIKEMMGTSIPSPFSINRERRKKHKMRNTNISRPHTIRDEFIFYKREGWERSYSRPSRGRNSSSKKKIRVGRRYSRQKRHRESFLFLLPSP
jgi:hypothetical protein